MATARTFALSGLEGCRFRLVIEDRLDDVRPDGYSEVLDLPDHVIRLGGDEGVDL